jgi:nucleotide-binding universal stress UspA family protein
MVAPSGLHEGQSMRFPSEVHESTDGRAVAHIAGRVADRVGAEGTKRDCVAMAYDGSDAAAVAAGFAARLASALGARLTVIHVLADPRSCSRPVLPMQRAVRELVDAALEGEEVDLRHVSAYRLPAVHLARAVDEVRPALLVVPAPARASWRTVLRRSIAAQLLRRSSQPIVVVAPRAVVPTKRAALAAS